MYIRTGAIPTSRAGDGRRGNTGPGDDRTHGINIIGIGPASAEGQAAIIIIIHVIGPASAEGPASTIVIVIHYHY